MVDWERTWRGNAVISAVLFLVAVILFGGQPKVGASAAKLVSFYDGGSTRILISTVVFGFAVLCLMWFAAALASVLDDAGKGGWGRAATTASAAIGGVYFTLITLWAALAYATAGSADEGFWAADGAYARLVPTIVMPLWLAMVSGFLMRRYSAMSAPERVPVRAA
jgi:hypothetical protein